MVDKYIETMLYSIRRIDIDQIISKRNNKIKNIKINSRIT
jgi:hypothetical protein